MKDFKSDVKEFIETHDENEMGTDQFKNIKCFLNKSKYTLNYSTLCTGPTNEWSFSKNVIFSLNAIFPPLWTVEWGNILWYLWSFALDIDTLPLHWTLGFALHIYRFILNIYSEQNTCLCEDLCSFQCLWSVCWCRVSQQNVPSPLHAAGAVLCWSS